MDYSYFLVSPINFNNKGRNVRTVSGHKYVHGFAYSVFETCIIFSYEWSENFKFQVLKTAIFYDFAITGMNR